MRRAAWLLTAAFILILIGQEGIGFWLWSTSNVFANQHEIGFDLSASGIVTPLAWRLAVQPFLF
jgi:hypothetical protein